MKLLLFAIPRGKEWLVILVVLLVFIYWVKTIITILKHENNSNKFIWLAITIFLGIFGAIIYNIWSNQTKNIASPN